jgi:hypothetical protein
MWQLAISSDVAREPYVDIVAVQIYRDGNNMLFSVSIVCLLQLGALSLFGAQSNQVSCLDQYVALA